MAVILSREPSINLLANQLICTANLRILACALDGEF